jgi:hypothetical protein
MEVGTTRKEALNKAIENLKQRRAKILPTVIKPVDTPVLKGRARLKTITDPVTPIEPIDPSISHLLERSATVEMLLDTRAALWVYSSLLEPAHAGAMSRETGASFMAHYWLGVRCLLEVGCRLWCAATM